MAMFDQDDLRSGIRLTFTEGEEAELRLTGINGQLLTNATTKVRLLNMSPDGLCFASDLQLPIQSNYLAEFRLCISKVHLNVRGRIVWRSVENGQHVHGVEFQCTDTLRSLIIGVMNQELIDRYPQQQKIHHLYSRLLHKKRMG
ncbi:PilZ domain-containing protein [Paenibacillus arenilitoris]|uniref:PilZ domain-containing protein n=1 Tax=Paenibacillus arenilitoris TaxID=2772299 RepID=A0A927H4J2_9BACL|nr:PilZ domain-containing protein [Paenibacillus arenilitoris]MBD2867950.1 PilZ domain-containing protein [Paenibacillus arenilitoris]